MVIALALLSVAGINANAAHAALEIESFTVSPSTTQIGAYPDLTTSVTVADPPPSESASSLQVALRPRLFAIPHAVSACSSTDFGQNECGPNAQVGLVTVSASHEGAASALLGTVPVYSLTRESAFGRLGFRLPTIGAAVTGELMLPRVQGYGLQILLEGLPETTPLTAIDLTLWGYPAAAEHDESRFPKGSPGSPPACPGLADAGCLAPSSTPSSLPVRPYLQSRGSCDDFGDNAILEVFTHESPGGAAFAESVYPAETGCDQVAFDASLGVDLSESARSVTGLDLELNNPHSGGLFPAPSPVSGIWLDFLGSLELEEAVAESHAACTPAQAGFAGEGPAVCPPGARVGSINLEAAVLPEALEGDVFYGGLTLNGEYRFFLVASGFGLDLKESLFIDFDPETGDLIADFELPPLPIEGLEVRLFSSSGLLLTGLRCSSYELEGILIPWNWEILGGYLIRPTVAFTSEPDGTPCPGPAADVGVSLQPPSVVADGTSTTTAIARVVDEAGKPIIGEEVEFISSDPGQKLAPVYDEIDGTYTVRIVASKAVGPVTITAIDRSVDPPVSGTAVLQQTSLPTSLPPAPTSVLRARITKRPPRRSRKRTAVFRFASTVPGSKFFCSLDRSRYRRCKSPARFRRLAPGKHRFRVFAKAPDGRRSNTAAHRFRVMPRKSGRRRDRG